MATPSSGWRWLGPRVCRRLRQSCGQGRAVACAEVRRANRAGSAGGASDPCRERARDRLCLAAAVEPCGLSADPRPPRHGQAVGRAAERKRDLAGEGRLCLRSHPHHGRSRPGRLSHRGLCAPVGRRAAGAPQPRVAGRSAGAAYDLCDLRAGHGLGLRPARRGARRAGRRSARHRSGRSQGAA